MAEDMDEMRNEVSQLDENGWNIHGELHPATCSRAFMIFSQVREDILEISLCSSTETSKARIESVCRRMVNIDTADNHIVLSNNGVN